MTGKTDYRKLLESDYIGQWDLEGKEPVLVIADVKPYRPAQKRMKRGPDGTMREEANKTLEIRFRGQRKAWLSKPATQKVIRGMYGKYIEDWIGKPIQLYVDASVRMGNEVTGGIRVRPTVPKGKATEQVMDAAPQPEKREQLERAVAAVSGTAREPGED